jgi:hypothetical protein
LNEGLLSLPAIQTSVLRFHLNTIYWGDHFTQVHWLLFPLFAAILGLAMLIVVSRAVPRRPSFVVTVIAIYLVGAAICASDRIMGYDLTRPRYAVSVQNPERLIDAIKAAPYDPRPYFDVGLVNYQLGLVDDAITPLYCSFLLDPSDPKARYALAVLLMSHGKPIAGTEVGQIEFFREHPDDVEVQAILVRLLNKAGFRLPALLRLREFIRENPGAKELQIVMQEMNLTPASLDAAIKQLGGS